MYKYILAVMLVFQIVYIDVSGATRYINCVDNTIISGVTFYDK